MSEPFEPQPPASEGAPSGSVEQGDPEGNPFTEEGKKDKRRWRWKRLESNPDVINPFIHNLGCPEGWGFSDCVGLTSEGLAMSPQPALAAVLLYPTKLDKAKKKEEVEAIKRSGQVVSDKVYYMEQLVGDACGTVAVCHALLNLHSTGDLPLTKDSVLETFYRETLTKGAYERGEALGLSEGICHAHTAASEGGKTKHEDFHHLSLHYVAFVKVDGHIYELDGARDIPRNRGPLEGDFLTAVGELVQREFVNPNLTADEEDKAKLREKGEDVNNQFSLISLGPLGQAPMDFSPHMDVEVEADPALISQLVDMGFGEDEAKTALVVSHNSLESAAGFLLG